MTKHKVISLAAEREKRRRQQERGREALKLLLAPKPKKRVAANKEPEMQQPASSAGKLNYKKGFSHARGNAKFDPPPRSRYYAPGYLEGLIWREYRRKVDWSQIFEDVLKGHHDDFLPRKPKNRPRVSATRFRDVCVMLDILIMDAREPTRAIDSIVEEVADKYGRSTRTVWNVWGDDTLDSQVRKLLERASAAT